MGLLRDSDVAEIRERLEGMVNPVKLIHFTQELNLEYGREARQLLEELAQISDKLSLETYDFLIDKEKVAEYAVDKVPATVIRNGKDYGIRFYGLPAGYRVCGAPRRDSGRFEGDSGLQPDSREKLAQLTSRFTCKCLPHPPDRIARRPCAWPTSLPWRATLFAPMALKPPNSRTSPRDIASSPSPERSLMRGPMSKALCRKGFSWTRS